MDKKFITSWVLIIIIVFGILLFRFINKNSMHKIIATKNCGDIFIQKSPAYFTDGTSRYIFNAKLNSCLIFNILADVPLGKYRITVVDMISDKILFAYELKVGESIDSVYAITKDKALDYVRSFGFPVF